MFLCQEMSGLGGRKLTEELRVIRRYYFRERSMSQAYDPGESILDGEHRSGEAEKGLSAFPTFRGLAKLPWI